MDVLSQATPQNFSNLSTEELKQHLLQLVQNRDTEPVSQKVSFYKNQLAPLFAEMNQRNPYQNPAEQVPLILGVWSSIWSTIPFQDLIPGRIRAQSYQIFHDDGYYANIARYIPGNQGAFLQKLSSFFLSFDLMLIQKFEVINQQWQIENIGIKQAFRIGAIPLTVDKAEDWFSTAIKSHSNLSATELKNIDQSTAKRLKTAYQATPLFEHIYIDSDLRIVKSQREAKQRPSYTIAVRID
jgi:uncharacterized protein YdaT